MNNQLLPDDDEEILRNLYSCNHNNKSAYDSMRAKHKKIAAMFPISLENNECLSILNVGAIYIHGRDK